MAGRDHPKRGYGPGSGRPGRTRKRPFRAAALAGLALLPIAAGPLPAQDAGPELQLGARPAALTLQSVDGKTVDLGTSIGSRPVYLEFWATWCPLCRALEPRVIAAWRRFGGRVAFFGIAVGVAQSPESVRVHLAAHPLPFPMLWDGRGAAVRTFRAPGTSYVVILDAEGRVAYTGSGSDQDLEGALERVVTDSASAP